MVTKKKKDKYILPYKLIAMEFLEQPSLQKRLHKDVSKNYMLPLRGPLLVIFVDVVYQRRVTSQQQGTYRVNVQRIWILVFYT